MSIDDGGPAFPCASEWGVGEAPFVQGGMTMRQWYAGQALAGMGMYIPPEDFRDEKGRLIPFHSQEYTQAIRKARAEWAVAQADALLAAEKTSTGQ